MSDKKKYSGYGYHGGGRKPLPEELKKKYITISVSGQPAEIERLKARAQEEHKTVSRFILDDIRKTAKKKTEKPAHARATCGLKVIKEAEK